MFGQSLEELAFDCPRVGWQFANAGEQADISVPGEMPRDFHHLMERFHEGKTLCIKEFPSLEMLCVLIREAMNRLRPGLATRNSPAFRMRVTS